jgi:hypothetical protein
MSSISERDMLRGSVRQPRRPCCPSTHDTSPCRISARRPFRSPTSPTPSSISTPMPPNRWPRSTLSTCSASQTLTRARPRRLRPRSRWAEHLRDHFSAPLILSQTRSSLPSWMLPPCNSPPIPAFSPPSLPSTVSNTTPHHSNPPCHLPTSHRDIPRIQH